MEPLLPPGPGLRVALLCAVWAAACTDALPDPAGEAPDAGHQTVSGGDPDAAAGVTEPAPPMTADALAASCGDGAIVDGAPIERRAYVQQVTATSAIVGWTVAIDAGEQVMVTTPAGDLVATVAALVEDTIVPSSSVEQRWATVDGLAPSTVYCYALTSAAGTLTARAGFRTAPAPDGDDTVRFVAFGDSGTGGSDQRAVFEVMREVPQDLIVHVGDIAYSAGTIDELEDRTFAIYAPLLRSVPIYAVAGNHEHVTDDAAPFRAAFALPGNERWYSFDWGPIHFAGLDTEESLDEQAAWLDADLAATDRPWKIVFSHEPPYSSGEHGSSEELRAALAPILADHGVQLMLSGHDHDYERTVPIDGVTYVVTGGGGGGLRPVGTSEFTAFSASVFHFLEIEVGAEELSIRAIDVAGDEIDAVVIPRS